MSNKLKLEPLSRRQRRRQGAHQQKPEIKSPAVCIAKMSAVTRIRVEGLCARPSAFNEALRAWLWEFAAGKPSQTPCAIRGRNAAARREEPTTAASLSGAGRPSAAGDAVNEGGAGHRSNLDTMPAGLQEHLPEKGSEAGASIAVVSVPLVAGKDRTPRTSPETSGKDPTMGVRPPGRDAGLNPFRPARGCADVFARDPAPQRQKGPSEAKRSGHGLRVKVKLALDALVGGGVQEPSKLSSLVGGIVARLVLPQKGRGLFCKHSVGLDFFQSVDKAPGVSAGRLGTACIRRFPRKPGPQRSPHNLEDTDVILVEAGAVL